MAEATEGLRQSGSISDLGIGFFTYRAFDGAELLYVGYTTNLHLRLGIHLQSAPWRGSVTRFEWDEWSTDEEARQAELAQIRDLRPRHNIWGFSIAGRGNCSACGAWCSGTGEDRLRSGLCVRDYRAWDRAARPDLDEFVADGAAGRQRRSRQ